MSGSNQTNGTQPQRQWVERSRKPDWVLRSVTVVTLIGWITSVAALALYYLGAPKESRPWNVKPGQEIGGGIIPANIDLLRGTFIAILVSCVVCAVGFVLNVTRHKRKTDKFNRLLITLSGVSLLLLIVFLINYGSYIF